MSTDSASAIPLSPYQGLGEHDHVAPLLARMAGLKGVAVPKHRFAYQPGGEDSEAFAELSLDARMAALWLGRFPDGLATVVSAKK